MESAEWIDSWLRSFCGNSSGLLLALLLLVLLDYITGICVAIQTKQLSSQIGAKGITKKVAMFVVIAFCLVLDDYLLHLLSILPERAERNKDFEVDDLLPWSEEMKSWFSAV